MKSPSKTVQRSETFIVGTIVYHPYYPRFLVNIHFGDKTGTVEVYAKCYDAFCVFTRNKNEQRQELMSTPLSEISERALEMAIRGDFMSEPNVRTLVNRFFWRWM